MHVARRKMSYLAAVLASATMVMAGCGNGIVSTGGSTISPAIATTSTSILVTDAPSDQVLSLSLTVDSIVLTDQAGNSTTILSTPVPVEASHLDAVQEPLLPPVNIPQDTYVSATFKVANPVVVYVDPTTGKAVTASATLANATDIVTFAKPIMVTAASSPICFDLLVGQSVTFSGSAVSVSPMFNVTQVPLAPQPTSAANGAVTGILGQVVSVSGTNLVVSTPNGQQLTIVTNTATQLQGIGALSALTAGELVDVDVAQQQSGSLVALRIHLVSPTAKSMFGGVVTTTTGHPVTSLTEVTRQPLGPQAPPTAAGTSYTVNVTGATTFGLGPQFGAVPALPFTPIFSASTMFAGQNVIVAASSVTGTTVTAESVTLAPQTVSGTVTAQKAVGGGLTAYTVTLPAQSALATLTGASSIVVYATPSTLTMNATAVVVGGQVRFNGLLFSNNGMLTLVAGASCDGPPPAPPQHP